MPHNIQTGSESSETITRQLRSSQVIRPTSTAARVAERDTWVHASQCEVFPQRGCPPTTQTMAAVLTTVLVSTARVLQHQLNKMTDVFLHGSTSTHITTTLTQIIDSFALTSRTDVIYTDFLHGLLHTRKKITSEDARRGCRGET